jgi:serine/threonine-protein kinase
MNSMIGEKLGSFRIDAVLGTGAMGVVYRGTNEKTDQPAAIKVIGSEIAKQGKAFERFRREADILQQFRHPNIVRFLAVGRFKGTSYFAMEYIAGENLEQLIARRGPLPWRDVVDLGIQTCEALHYAHQHGVVHRDLKPSNLMVTAEGQVKLTDFGIAKDLDATALTAPGRTMGTAAYMAPEQIRGTPEISHKTDLYPLGVVLYQLLTGQPAFSGASAVVLMHCHLNQPPPRPSAKVHEIPLALDDLIVKLMAKAPVDRPWDAAAVAHALTELRDKDQKGEKIAMVWPTEADKSVPNRAGLEPAPRQSKDKRRKKAARGWAPHRAWVGTAGLLVALLAVSGAIAYVVWPPRQEYLFDHAKALMDSKNSADWAEAVNRYLDPLDQRFPENPYKTTTRPWRDRVLLNQAERRAGVLERRFHSPYYEPNSNVERTYLAASDEASTHLDRGDDGRAAEAWSAMAKSLRPDDRDERPWQLLAEKRARDLRQKITERRKFVEGLVQKYNEAQRKGNSDDAEALRKNLLENYGKYTDLNDLLRTVEAPPAAPGASPEPTSPKSDSQ